MDLKFRRFKLRLAGRPRADIRGRTSKLSKEIEELKAWAAALPKSSDSENSHTH
jgi:hypothetical protein